MESSRALVEYPNPDSNSPATVSSVSRAVERSVRRGALAASHRYALALLFVTVVSASAAAGFGAVTLAHGMLLVGAILFSGFVMLHIVSPTRGDALYGEIGPPIDPKLLPCDITAPEVRTAYCAVLDAHDRVRESLDQREGTIEMLREPYARCGELVRLAGDVAGMGNALDTYIRKHSRQALSVEVGDLRRRAAATRDEQARCAYERAAEARERQLEHYNEFCGLRDRIQARLELIAASLEAVQALVVKLHARLLEQSAFVDESMADGLDVLHEDLQILEDALDEALHGPVGDLPATAVAELSPPPLAIDLPSETESSSRG